MASYGIDYIDILKVDIEGAVIIIELHDRYTVGSSRNFYLATRNFEVEMHRGENVLMARGSCVNTVEAGSGTT
jgi:hypothetical protein